MDKPLIADLSPKLQELQKRWLGAPREKQDLIYAGEFGPNFTPLFSKLPLHGAGTKPPIFKALISVLGLSWQPVALMASWANPERILVLGTQDSLSMRIGDEPVLYTISRVSNIPLERISMKQVGDSDEIGIYREVRDFLHQYGYGPHEIAVDPTGGKKSMSVSAALAGFLSGAWIVYVDYADYDAKRRIPIAGTEYPRLLRNPLEVFGELEFRKIRGAIRRGNYEEAFYLARDLASRLYEPREAEALALVAKTYGAWHGFKFIEANDAMQELVRHLDRFAGRGKWAWSTPMLEMIAGNKEVLGELSELTRLLLEGKRPQSMQEAFPLVLNHLESSERALEHRHVGGAMLLIYANLERYADLALWIYFGLDDERPDFSALKLDLSLFHDIGRRFHGNNYQERAPSGPIGLSLGIQLLATLKPELMPAKCLGPIRGLMNDRNKCEYEHGLCPKSLEVSQVTRHIEVVKELIRIGMEEIGKDPKVELVKYRFPAAGE